MGDIAYVCMNRWVGANTQEWISVSETIAPCSVWLVERLVGGELRSPSPPSLWLAALLCSLIWPTGSPGRHSRPLFRLPLSLLLRWEGIRVLEGSDPHDPFGLLGLWGLCMTGTVAQLLHSTLGWAWALWVWTNNHPRDHSVDSTRLFSYRNRMDSQRTWAFLGFEGRRKLAVLALSEVWLWRI